MAERAQTPEAVAYDLMTYILNSENGSKNPRKNVLALYEECLRAAKGHELHGTPAQ